MSEPTKRIKLSGNMIAVDMESAETESEIIDRLTREISESKAAIKRLEAENAFISESHLAQENKRLVAEMLELRNAIQRDTDAFIRLTRERDEARTLAARRGEVLEKLVSKASASLASAGIQEGELGDRIEWACVRVKRLEEELGDWKRCADNLHDVILRVQQDADFLGHYSTKDTMDEFDALKAKEAKP